LPHWCADHLGGEPAKELFVLQQVSMVFGLRLTGCAEVVVKARADDGRAVSCVAVQASGAFASSGPPALAPVESSEAFLVAFQDRRGRVFTAAELEVAWAASVWTAACNLWEALHGDTPLPGDALRAQAAERLRRASA
jgi:hypothetical protein